MRRLRSVLGLALCTVGALLALAVPAGAQQLVDAGGEGNGSGGLAFVLMVVMVVDHRRLALLHGPRAPESSASGRRQPVATPGRRRPPAPRPAFEQCFANSGGRGAGVGAMRRREARCRGDGFVDVFVCVREGDEEGLVAAGGEEVAGAQQVVEELRVAGVVGLLGFFVVRDRVVVRRTSR